MSTSLSWPRALPKPLLDTHALQPRPPVARTETERGYVNQRRRFAQVPTDVPFSLVLDEQQMSIFEAWVEHKALHGARWFSIDLWSGIGLATHEARIRTVEEYKQIRRDRWTASGMLEVRERPMLDADMLALALEFGSLEEMIAAFDVIGLQVQTIQLMGNNR